MQIKNPLSASCQFTRIIIFPRLLRENSDAAFLSEEACRKAPVWQFTAQMLCMHCLRILAEHLIVCAYLRSV